MIIVFTEKIYQREDLTVGNEYEVKAFSKTLDSYRVINDNGIETWCTRENFVDVRNYNKYS